MSTIAPGPGAKFRKLHINYASEIQQMHALMGQSPVAMCVYVGEEVRVGGVNELMLEIWGRPLAQVLNRPLMDVLPELRGQGFDDSIRNVMATEQPYTAEEMEIDLLRDGKLQTRTYNFVYKPYYSHGGVLIGVVNVATDVTEIVKGRRAVEERELRLQELNHLLEAKVAERTIQLEHARQTADNQRRELQRAFGQAPVAIYVVKGPKYTLDLINPVMCEVLDQQESDALGRPLFDVIPAAADQGFEDLLDGVMRTGLPVSFNDHPVRLLRQGVENTAYFNFVYHPYIDEHNEVVGVTAVAVEVTEHVLVRRRVEASEQRFSLLLESLPQMTWTNLPDGSINYFSTNWTRYTGRSSEEMKGWAWEMNVHPDDYPALIDVYNACVREEHPFMHEDRLRNAAGEYRWHLSRSVPLRDEAGQVFLWVGTSTDIHELRNAEAELQRLSEELTDANDQLSNRNRELAGSNKQLKRINADLDSFVYAASHDLKAPITNIQGLHALLQSELPSEDQEEVTQILDMMDASITRFMRAIADLSDVARIQKAEQEPADTLDVEAMVDEVRADLLRDIQLAGAQIQLDVSDCAMVHFARKDLRSIIYNLLSNAVKYRSPARPVQVQINCQREGAFTVVTVKDNGLGMDLSGEHKLFSMFYRMHQHVDGSGVGLHIVKRILDARGGRVEVDSAVDVGTTFRVYLPNQSR